MNQDNRKKDATKHYQNSDYPSGSFEAAINCDHQDRLREGTGLRLERHPLSPGNSGADLEEMVPAFMHRDFFRSEEDAVDAITPSSRLRGPRKEAPAVAAGGYTEPPNTEEIPPPPPTARPSVPIAAQPTARPSVPTAAQPSPYARPTQAPISSPASHKASAQPAPAPEEPLAPLRASVAPAAAPEPATPPPPAAPPAPQPAAATYPPTVVSPKSTSPYSIPMLVALALVMGIFVWREQTRPAIVAQEPLPVPQTVSSPPAPTPAAEPTPAGTGFRPTYMAVGPPVPQDQASPGATSAQTDPSSEEGALVPGEEGENTAEQPSQEDAAERAAMLERMSRASSEDSAPTSDDSGQLFPVDEAAPVRETGGPVKADAQPVPRAEPKPAPKAEPKPVPVAASAADLFPIDEELPIKPAKPKNTAAVPVAQPQPVAQPAQPLSPPPEGYQIDEPSL